MGETMNTAAMPIPGALRLRNVEPLEEPDGSCRLVYDLERARLLEVPEELQLHALRAIESGELSDELFLSWAVEVGLVTWEGWAEWRPAPDRLELLDVSASDSLPTLVRTASNTSMTTVRLGWSSGALPPGDEIRTRVEEAHTLASEVGQEFEIEITLPLAAVESSLVSLFESLPHRLRIDCGAFPTSAAPRNLDAWERRQERIGALVERGLAPRITAFCIATHGIRLIDAWIWAKDLGLSHLDLEFAPAGPAAILVERDLRTDLAAVVDQICADLEAKRETLAYQPIVRVVRRLIAGEPPERHWLRSPWVGDVGPGSGLQGMGARDVAGLWLEGISEVPFDAPCATCWARYLCSNSWLTIGSEGAAPRTLEACGVRRAEAEAGLRLAHRLRQMEPEATETLLGGPPRGGTPLRRSGDRQPLPIC
mgnify:CR=1 FL=1